MDNSWIIHVKKESLFGKLLYLCSVKAAIKRAKSRKLAFELFRAKADSNEVQTLNNENYAATVYTLRTPIHVLLQ